MSPSDADNALSGWTHDIQGDMTTGQKNKIQAQNPDHTQCIALTTNITLHYRPN